jgi:predicted N-formylglutamate amidohydrolase
LLESHRGFDRGALELAQGLARRFGVPLDAAPTSRILIDLNRSPGNRNLYSEFTAALSPAEKQRIYNRYYLPHRNRVEKRIAAAIRKNRAVLHIGVHTFTPILHGTERQADIGLLYDPARAREKRFCHAWKNHLRRSMPSLRIRSNYPYKGVSDGFPTWLRRIHPPRDYIGMELEVNHKHSLGKNNTWELIARALEDALARVLEA